MASILAIGTANPPNCYYQADYPDYYFRVTGSEHLTQLKEKFKRMCERSKIKKRYMYLTEDILKENPSICSLDSPSLSARQAILVNEVPKLRKEAAMDAIKEWGQPKSKITHLIFSTNSGFRMPSADLELCKLLELPSTVKRYMLYLQGCFGGATALRLAKDIAENNSDARILIVCSENTTICFRPPSDTYLDHLVGSALFSDGAAAVIVGSNPDETIERPLFQLLLSEQCTIPDLEHLAFSNIGEVGGLFHLHKDLPDIVAKLAAQRIVEIFKSKFETEDWKSLFYIVHQGGPAILDSFETELGLTDKLKATRHALSEYGNMWSCSVFFALDEMRKKSVEEGKATTGEGLDLGVLMAFGPGLTLETIVLRSFPIEV